MWIRQEGGEVKDERNVIKFSVIFPRNLLLIVIELNVAKEATTTAYWKIFCLEPYAFQLKCHNTLYLHCRRDELGYWLTTYLISSIIILSNEGNLFRPPFLLLCVWRLGATKEIRWIIWMGSQTWDCTRFKICERWKASLNADTLKFTDVHVTTKFPTCLLRMSFVGKINDEELEEFHTCGIRWRWR